MARLIIVSGPEEGTEHRLEGGRISIGRDPANTIVLGDSLVSKRHAEIICDEDGSLLIVDVGSSNGTVVNDRQVVEHRLVHDDQLQLGDCRLRFESEPLVQADDEGAKTVLIDDAATRLAIPADAVAAARTAEAEPSSGDAVAESTIYISDDEAMAPVAPPAAADPGAGSGLQKKKNNLPVMPILLAFIAVMITIGCLLTWKVVQRSRGEAAGSAPAAVPAVGGSDVPDTPVSLADETAGAGEEAAGSAPPVVVEEENLIAEPSDSGEPVQIASPAVTGSRSDQAPASATPPPARITPPPTRATTPPPTRTTPPPTRIYTPPPARPREVPPSTGGTSTPADPPPATTPARPAAVVPDATHGVLHVITKPAGATIYINEEMVGTTNTKKLMSAGKYIIRLEYQGQTVNDDVKVKVQQVATFYHDFTPPAPSAGEDDEDEDDEDDDDEDDDDEDDDDDDDEDDDDDDDDDKKKKKGFKKKLKDIFG